MYAHLDACFSDRRVTVAVKTIKHSAFAVVTCGSDEITISVPISHKAAWERAAEIINAAGLPIITTDAAPAPLSLRSNPMRLRMTCPLCGSPDIARVGCDARWDEARQEWIAGEAESCVCDACAAEFDAPRETEIAEQKEAA